MAPSRIKLVIIQTCQLDHTNMADKCLNSEVCAQKSSLMNWNTLRKQILKKSHTIEEIFDPNKNVTHAHISKKSLTMNNYKLFFRIHCVNIKSCIQTN